MIREKEIADPNSCLNKAQPGEPVFVLRANDENAPHTVRQWAQNYVESKGQWYNMTPEQRAKRDEALQLARDMEEWKRARS